MDEINSYLNVRDFGAKGSDFSTSATATKGSRVFRACEIGDIEVGDSVLVLGAKPRVVNAQLYVRTDTSPVNPRPPKRRYMIGEELELLGYEGGDDEVYVVDMYPEAPGVVRWTKDNGRNWVEDVPVVDGVAELELGRRLVIHEFEDFRYGCTAVFHCTSRTTATVEAISGKEITLSVESDVSGECIISHDDSPAIQSAVDAAIEQRKGVFIPQGRYRISNTVKIFDADSISVIGEEASGVILDNSGALPPTGVDTPNGACFRVRGSRSVTLKNMTMIGNLGFADRDLAGCIKTTKGVEPSKVYGFYYKYTAAVTMADNEKVLIENCHGRKMSGECFYARSTEARIPGYEPEKYQKSLTFLNCSVEDCGRNAFNNNDRAENTSVMYCRIRDVGGCAWEGSSRFVKIIGNYIRNAGPVAIGNLRSRDKENELLGTAQHIVSDNYFESGVCYGGGGITVGAAATQVAIKNNTFVNFNSTAIRVVGLTQHSDLPAEHVIITGNSIDLTAIDSEPKTTNEFLPTEPYTDKRMGIFNEASFVTIADNHIFVRHATYDDTAVGIYTSKLAEYSNIHDNTISRLLVGIKMGDAVGRVGLVVDDTHFYRYEPSYGIQGAPPIPRRFSDRLANRLMLLESGERATIESCDPETKLFTLKAPAKISEGDRFVYYPESPSFRIHDNMIVDCADAFVGNLDGICCQNNLIK